MEPGMYLQTVPGALGSSRNEKEGNSSRDKGTKQDTTKMLKRWGCRDRNDYVKKNKRQPNRRSAPYYTVPTPPTAAVLKTTQGWVLS